MITSLTWQGGGTHQNLTVLTGRYADGSLALQLMDDYELVATVSVNLTGYHIEVGPGCFWVRNYSESEGLGQALVMAGVLERTGRSVHFGPFAGTGADEYRLLSLAGGADADA